MWHHEVHTGTSAISVNQPFPVSSAGSPLIAIFWDTDSLYKEKKTRFPSHVFFSDVDVGGDVLNMSELTQNLCWKGLHDEPHLRTLSSHLQQVRFSIVVSLLLNTDTASAHHSASSLSSLSEVVAWLSYTLVPVWHSMTPTYLSSVRASSKVFGAIRMTF